LRLKTPKTKRGLRTIELDQSRSRPIARGEGKASAHQGGRS
jgi:hypothetical protein